MLICDHGNVLGGSLPKAESRVRAQIHFIMLFRDSKSLRQFAGSGTELAQLCSHPQAELKDRSSPPSDVPRGCRDIRTATQT